MERGFELASTHLHLTRVLLTTGRDAEARTELELSAKQTTAEPYLPQRIEYFRILLGELDGTPAADAISRMKEELPRPDAVMGWDLSVLLAQLKPWLTLEAYDFLQALGAAINDRNKLGDLDGFPQWHAYR